MSDAGHYNPFRSTIASEFIGNDDARMTTSRSPQHSAKETYGRESIPPWLHKDVKHNAILINGSPEVMSNAVYLEENLVKCHLSPVRARRLLRPSAYALPNLSHQHRIVS